MPLSAIGMELLGRHMFLGSLLPSPYRFIDKNISSSCSLPAYKLFRTMDISMGEEGSHPIVLPKVFMLPPVHYLYL